MNKIEKCLIVTKLNIVKVLIISILAFFSICFNCRSAEITLRWDKPDPTDAVLEGYILVKHTESFCNSESIIIDNGNEGTSSTGTWQVSSGPNPYGDSSVYSREGTYTFQADVSGEYLVDIRWTYWENRCTSVPVKIYSNNILLTTEYLNQLDESISSTWRRLGSFTFENTVKVIIETLESCTTSADAASIIKNDVSVCEEPSLSNCISCESEEGPETIIPISLSDINPEQPKWIIEVDRSKDNFVVVRAQYTEGRSEFSNQIHIPMDKNPSNPVNLKFFKL